MGAEGSRIPQHQAEGFKAPDQGIIQFGDHLQVAELQRKLTDLRTIADKAFSRDQNGRVFPLVNHTSDPHEPFIPALEYLQEVTGEPDELRQIFGPRGNFVHSEGDTDPLSIEPKELMSYLRGSNRLIYDLAEHSPDAHSEEGYNRHGDMHNSRVMRNTFALVQSSGGTKMDQILGVFSAGMHDDGYPFAKEAHALVASNMTEFIFPSLSQPSESFEEQYGTKTPMEYIRRIIDNHDSDVLKATIAGWGNLGPNEVIARMADYLGKPGLALIIADKLDVGRDRISWKQRPSRMRRDKHAELNLLGQNAGLGEFGNHLVWKLKFTPEITEADKKKYPNWARSLVGEESMEELYHHWVSLFWRIYGERTALMAQAALGLYPNAEGFEIQFLDEGRLDDKTIRKTFNRGTLEKDIESVTGVKNSPRGQIRR